uniref:hypothetical protein n=1 Tax=Nocardia suismassiliense TaxID=2077092 RepID=UPI003F497930
MTGRVLDTSAIIDVANRGSIYVRAILHVAVREGYSIVVPAAALVAASSVLSVQHRDDLAVLLNLSVVTISDLPAAEAVGIGLLTAQGRVDTGHVLWCARHTTYPILTSDASWIRSLDGTVELDTIP